MIIKFNPTGTHIHKGLLKVRVDLYPEPTDKTYTLHHIQVPDITSRAYLKGYKGKLDEFGSPINQEDYNLWIESLPKIWQLSPCLCHFIVVPETIILADVNEYVARLFDKDTVATLDNALVQPNAIHLVSTYMRGKSPFTNEKVKTKDFASLIAVTNQKLTSLSASLLDGGEILIIEPGSVVIGAGATNRGATWDSNSYTLVDRNVPANAGGTLDTCQINCAYTGGFTNLVFGTFFLVSGTTYETRDSESVGDEAGAGLHTFTNLSIVVSTSDCIGCYYTASGNLERDTSEGSGFGFISGDYTTPTTQASYNFTYSDDILSLYGTGTEAAAGWANIAKVSGVAAATFAKMNGVAVADIAKVNGVAV